MNRIIKLTTFLLLSIFITQVHASNLKYYNNFRQNTDAEPRGNEMFVTAKGGVLIYNMLTSQKQFYTKANSNLPSNEVEQVAKSNITNDIWIGTYDNGLARWNGTDFDVFAFPANFGLLYSMKFGPDGNLYIQTNNGLINLMLPIIRMLNLMKQILVYGFMMLGVLTLIVLEI